jgi:hypothetical protein
VDIFIIWLHSLKGLLRFLYNLKNLPFLDIDIYRSPDGIISQRVSTKPTLIDLYMNSISHHHLAQKIG